MSALDVAAATDVGRVRESNEDAFYEGEAVFAVADGMGGHLAGEVASATALEPVSDLDGRVFPDAASAVEALRAAVIDANRRVASKASDDPNFRGMGTTLTAAMLEGRRLHLAHVGDSRAYLLRNGEFSQLTTDHTLVQHLIDEGQITRDEAARHPQRSIITRAIGVSTDVEVDSMSLELEPGDQILLCSDGLTGVVDDDTLADELRSSEPLDETVQRLVELANENGGPDNITVLLLRRRDSADPAPTTSAAASAASSDTESTGSRTVIRTGDGRGEGDWADRLGRLGTLGRSDGRDFGDHEPRRRGPTRMQRVGAALLVVLLVGALGFLGGRWLLSRSYYVGLADGQVAIFQGVPAELGPFALSWQFEETDLTVEDVPQFYRDDLREGITAADLTDARRIVVNAPRTTPSPSPSPSPDRSPAAPSPTPASPTPSPAP